MIEQIINYLIVNGSWLRPQGPGQAPLSHEPLTINNRLINEFFVYILQVLGIKKSKF